MTPRIGITTGDIDGIGAEVCSKALLNLSPNFSAQYFVWIRSRNDLSNLSSIEKMPGVLFLKKWDEFEKLEPNGKTQIVFFESADSPSDWVEAAAQLALESKIHGMVTGPLSKSGIIDAGKKDIGHTEILARVTGTKNLFMSFLGQKFNVILLTGHMSLNHAYEKIDFQITETAIDLTHKFIKYLPEKQRSLPIALVGANPHSGEGGLLGTIENDIYLPSIKAAKQQGVQIDGPLVPDVCFQPKYWDKYSAYIASYHDQGLIPFKMIHSNTGGVHMTMGLPFIRTSVDHGTAKDIYGLNKADSKSMFNAILMATSLVKKESIGWKNA